MSDFFKNHSADIIFIAVTLVTAFLLIRFIRYAIGRYLRRNEKVSKSEATNYQFIKNSISAIIFIIALIIVVYRLPGGQTIALSLFASAGIIAAIVGFASQAAFSNIVAGVFIVIFKPFRVEDMIKVGTSDLGTVEDITLRHTVIRDFQNRRIIIPNSIISNETILNLSIDDPKIRRHIEFGISYDSNVQLAKTIMREEALKHPLCIDNRTQEAVESGEEVVEVRVVGFTDSAVTIRAWVWSATPEESFLLFTDLNESIKARFEAEGIEIPFPYRTLVFKDGAPAKGVPSTSP